MAWPFSNGSYPALVDFNKLGRRGGSVGRASGSRPKDRRFEPRLRQEHTFFFGTNVFRVKDVLTQVVVGVCAHPRVTLYTHAKE